MRAHKKPDTEGEDFSSIPVSQYDDKSAPECRVLWTFVVFCTVPSDCSLGLGTPSFGLVIDMLAQACLQEYICRVRKNDKSSEKEKSIKATLLAIKRLREKCEQNFHPKDVFSTLGTKDFLLEFEKIKAKISNTYANFIFDETTLSQIEEKSFAAVEKMDTFDLGIFLYYILGLERHFSKLLPKKVKTEGIVKIQHPFEWKDITISIRYADEVEVFQKGTSCGLYTFDSLGIPTKGSRKLSDLFSRMIIENARDANFSNSDLLNLPRKITDAEKIISSIRTQLKSAFRTMENPIKKSKVSKKYRTVFRCLVPKELYDDLDRYRETKLKQGEYETD